MYIVSQVDCSLFIKGTGSCQLPRPGAHSGLEGFIAYRKI